MTLVFRSLSRDNLADVIALDGAFTVEAELIPSARDGIVTYAIAPVPAYQKRYADNDEDELGDFIDAADKMFLLAYAGDRLAGHVSVAVHWNRYAFIDHLAVDAQFRRHGVGQALVTKAVAWARERQLPGVMLETQNNNVAACKLYERLGFTLGGFDRFLYRGEMPETREIALFWYLPLERADATELMLSNLHPAG
jgi:ribosomal protein S18 acetylase RimI-like enzyme